LAASYEEARAIKKELEMEYQSRHTDLKKLRDFWHGRYWEKWGGKDRSALSSLFRDIPRGPDRNAPDFRVVHNIIQEVCVKYQAFLSPLPMIRVYVDPPGTSTKRKQANKKERFLYSLWGQQPVAMKDVLNRIAWYLPLMGDCFLGAFPDIENNTIRPIVRSPEYAYPIQSYDGSTLDQVIFSWETTKQKAARQFPSYDPDAGMSNPLARITPGRKKNDKVEVIELSTGKEFARWIDGQKVAGVEHNYGFNIFDQLAFIFVPDEPFNHGAVEQAINLNEAENVLRSLLLQAVIENVFPRYVLIDPSKAPEELDMSAGAVWGVAAGGDVKTLAPPLQAVPIQQGFIQENERVIKQATAMPDAQFGSFPGGSTHISGKAINEMQGAGTGSTIEMVQGLGIGSGLVSWNEKALIMGRKYFADETINVSGYETGSAIDITPRYFSINIKGKELVGSCRNEVVFSPHIDLHNKLIMNLQAMGAGLVSKEHARNQMGIPDSEAMDEEILEERMQDIVLMAIETQLTADPTPEAAASAESQALGFLAGQGPTPGPPPAMGAPLVPPPPGAPPGGAGQGGPPPPPGGGGGMPIASMPGGGQLAAPALRMPGGAALPGAGMNPPGFGAGADSPVPGEGAPGAPNMPPEPGAEGEVTLDVVTEDFQNMQGLSGRVFLVGEILDGSTDEDVEVSITDDKDKQTIIDQATDLQGKIRFHTVSAEPKEPHMEVTPGVAPEHAGEEPDLTSILGGEQ
jgi:hypothetical protein